MLSRILIQVSSEEPLAWKLRTCLRGALSYALSHDSAVAGVQASEALISTQAECTLGGFDTLDCW
jgi:hypothetical protein